MKQIYLTPDWEFQEEPTEYPITEFRMGRLAIDQYGQLYKMERPYFYTMLKNDGSPGTTIQVRINGRNNFAKIQLFRFPKTFVKEAFKNPNNVPKWNKSWDKWALKRGLIWMNGRLASIPDVCEQRTLDRIDNDIYKPLPNDFPKYYGTGAHTSTQNEEMVAYYPDNRHILEDRPVMIKPGRYLKRYWPYMSDTDVRLYSNMMFVTYGFSLVIYDKAEDMIRIYMELKNKGIVESCMAKNHWSRHPLEAYDQSDVGLAVLYNKYNEPRARALINKVTKEYPMIYGEWEKMQQVLKVKEYKHGSLEGAKINKIWLDDNVLLMPYIDAKRTIGNRSDVRSENFDVYSDYCLITRNGAYDAGSTDGSVNIDDDERGNYCECCEGYFSDSNFVDYDNIALCGSCYDDYVASDVWISRDRSCDVYTPSHDIITIGDEAFLNEDVAIQHGYNYCEYDDEWYHNDDLVEVNTDTDGNTEWWPNQLLDDAFFEHTDGKYYLMTLKDQLELEEEEETT